MTTDNGSTEDGASKLRKVAVPTAVTAAGAAAGVVLTQKAKLRGIVSELRDRVETVLANRAAGDGNGDGKVGGTPARDQAERNARRADRKKRRERRRRQTAT
jgi:hypothetical protein